MKSYNLKGFIDVVEIEQSEIEKIDMDLCQEPRETISHYYNRMKRKPEVLINGGLFNLKDGKTCFSFVDDHEVIKEYYGVHRGLGNTTDLTTLEFGEINDGRDWNDFIAGYPVLVEDGIPIRKVTWASEINYKAFRSAIGITKSKKIIVLTVGKPGMIFQDLADVMVDLGCEYAINLDGGRSSRLMVNGKVVNHPIENRSVDSVIAIYLKEEIKKEENTDDEAPYISYTVQRGDSLWKISAHYLGAGTRYKEIVNFNHLSSSVLKVGQVLKIPVDCEKYVIKYGDSLWKIAADKLGSGAKYKYLMEFNNLKTTTINPGQVIYIPV